MDQAHLRAVNLIEKLANPGLKQSFLLMVGEARKLKATNPIAVQEYWRREIAALPSVSGSALSIVLSNNEWDVDKVLKIPSHQISWLRGIGPLRAGVVSELVSHVNKLEATDPLTILLRRLELLPKEEQGKKIGRFLRMLKE